MVCRHLWLPIALSCTIMLSVPVLAHEEKQFQKPWKKFSVNLGGSLLDVSSNVRLGVKGVGIGIDPEELFNMDSISTVFRTDGYWRFSKNRRHRLDFSYLSWNREGNAILGRNIDLGDTTLPLGTEVNTSLKLDIIKVGYSYSFYQDDRIDLAIATGLYILPIDYELQASGLVNESQTETITAPLPLLGVRADFAITPKWFLRNNFELFYLKISNYEGSLFNGRVGVEYNPFKHVGFGLSAEVLSLTVEAEKGTEVPGVDFNGLFDIEQIGLFGYISFYF